MLLWRVGSSEITADHLIQGRNVVAAADGGGYAVNPAVSGTELCELFPTEGGVDVVTDGSSRLSVPYATLFAVGQFQAMVLKAEDASRAVKSRTPFAWPARGVRQALMCGLIVVGVVVLAAAALMRERKAVEADIAARHGAEMVAQGHRQEQKEEWSDEDIFIYRLTCLCTIPSILTADRSIITADLIHRGEQLLGHGLGTNDTAVVRGVKRLVRFLGDVDAIQGAVQKGDWEKLVALIAEVDKSTFVRFDADVFLSDAVEIANFVQVKLPEFFLSVSAAGSAGLAKTEKHVEACFDTLDDNLFMSGAVVSRERVAADERWTTLAGYIPMRDKFLAGDAASIMPLLDAWGTFVDVFDEEDAAFAPLVARERGVLVEALKKRAATADDVSLIYLCDLGEAVGMDESSIGDWRRRAEIARKELAVRYRTLYSDYRMKSAVAPGAPETLAVLDEMIALGLAENTFHKWALREKERVTAPAKEESK